MKYAITFTTIHLPTVLESYLKNLEKYGHTRDTFFVIAGDYKTPAGTREYCADITKQGFKGEYLGVEEQKDWLESLPKLADIIPWNSDCRRNIAYLVAAQRGADMIISIDDDNYASTEWDFIGQHSRPGVDEIICSANGWVNPCRLLETSPSRVIYPRGFPYNRRWQDTYEQGGKIHSPIMVNQGLWLGAPDVDAVSNLEIPTIVDSSLNKRMALADANWAPINTQNTSFRRQLLPCWFFMPMGFVYNGLVVDRYADIWLGYFVQKCMEAIGGTVCYGLPLVRHIRNKHDYMKDLEMELGGMILTQHLVEFLEKLSLRRISSYADAYVELGSELWLAAKAGEFTREGESYFSNLRTSMEIWVEACEKVM